MNRLDLLAKLANNSNTLLDIGCDHGYVIIKALKYYNVKNAIASELTDVQLNNAKKNVYTFNLDKNVKFVVSDGFKNITDDFDTCVIAGMGGNLISNILLNGQDKLKNKKLILEANKDQRVVRETLVNIGYKIIDEHAIVDKNKYYEIIVAINEKEEYNELELKYGPILLNNLDCEFCRFYINKINNLEKIIKNTKSEEVIQKSNQEINEIKEVLGDKYELYK